MQKCPCSVLMLMMITMTWTWLRWLDDGSRATLPLKLSEEVGLVTENPLGRVSGVARNSGGSPLSVSLRQGIGLKCDEKRRYEMRGRVEPSWGMSLPSHELLIYNCVFFSPSIFLRWFNLLCKCFCKQDNVLLSDAFFSYHHNLRRKLPKKC